jgi:hypothetical protein
VGQIEFNGAEPLILAVHCLHSKQMQTYNKTNLCVDMGHELVRDVARRPASLLLLLKDKAKSVILRQKNDTK